MAADDADTKRRALVAERQRRHRIRKRCGVVPVVVELEEGAIASLVERGELSKEDLADKSLLAESLGYLISKLLASRRDTP